MMKTRRIAHLLISVVMMIGCLPVMAQADRNYVRSGNKLYRQQKYAQAETEYRKALDKNSNNTQAMYNLGCALLMQQKDSSAIALLEKAGKAETAKKRKAMAYHNIGVICQNHQLYSQAIEAYKESLRNNPSDNQTRYNLALCKRQMKNQKGGGNKNQKKQEQKKQKQENKDKKQNKQQKQQSSPQKAEEKMSKDNAEQLLNAAIQEEKATQQRMKKQQQSAQRRRLQKNW